MTNNLLNSTLKSLESWAEKEDEILAALEMSKMLQPVKPFPAQQSNKEYSINRIERSRNDFWYYDKTYFPPDVYDEYSAPGKFHKNLILIGKSKDKKAHVIHGPRECGKTITFKKFISWCLIFGHRKFMGIGSASLTVPMAFILDIIYLLESNERIKFDYDLKWVEKSTEKIYVRNPQNPRGTFVIALSEGRSARGSQRMFDRLDFVYVTDFENLTTSLTKDAVENRIEVLNEMRGSLSKSGTLVWEGNNFHADCAMNKIKKEKDAGKLSPEFDFHHFPAWDNNRDPKNIWHSKFPAKSEVELKLLMKPKDDYDWQGNYQGMPKKRGGDIFPEDCYQEAAPPPGLLSVTYCDPNLSLKEKGDTTAMLNLAHDPTTDYYYITKARCKSYSSSNNLLKDYLQLWIEENSNGSNVVTSGMDGNVTQESVWTNNVLNFTALNKIPYPNIKFKRYNVDALVTNFQDKWKGKKVFFPPGFQKTEEGKIFTDQVFAFALKKAGKKDDAPDTLICAYTLLVEEGVAYVFGTDDEPVVSAILKRNRKI